MAISAVNSSTAAAAQLLDQVRQANAKPEATESKAAERTATDQRSEAAGSAQENAQTAAPQPVVNTQGQVTGQFINTFA